MAEKAIIFNGEMVKAILAGRKTQTRRLLKPHPKIIHAQYSDASLETNCIFRGGDQRIHSPYGKVGDLLYVREHHYLWGHWIKNGLSKIGKQKWKFIADRISGVKYSDVKPATICRKKTEAGWFSRPSIHMPKWAARIWLEVTNVRVERVQEISEEDAQAEGIYFDGTYWLGGIHPVKKTLQCWPTAKMAFEKLWDSIYGNWKENPFVWVYEFKWFER